MALQTPLTFRDRKMDAAYIMVPSVTIEKDAYILAKVRVYATALDRRNNLPPVDEFSFQLPYSDTPFAAVFVALRQKYPNATNV